VVLLFVPDSLGRLVLDDVWGPASQLILPVTLSVTGSGVITGAAAGLRALGAARRSLRSQLCQSAGYLGFGLTGAALGGAVGMSWCSTAAMWLGAALWWWQLRAGLRDHLPVSASDITAGSTAGPAPESVSGDVDHREVRTS
jgi:hypothetical protein